MTTAIVGVGNIGSAVARHLVSGGESVVLAAKDESRAQALAKELGPLAQAASVEAAISGADAVVFAVWLDTMRELIPAEANLLRGKSSSTRPTRSASTHRDRCADPARRGIRWLGGGSLASRRSALRQGLRHPRRGRPRRERPPQPAGRAVLRNRRRSRREDGRAADSCSRIRAVESRRRSCRRADRSAIGRPAPVRLQRRGRRHRPGPVRHCEVPAPESRDGG